MRSYTAGPNEEGMRLSRFVQRVAPRLPASAMHKHFRNKRIKVNGKRQPPEYRLLPGDLVELYINDEFFAAEVGKRFAATGSAPLPPYQTTYEDEGIAVLYKPAGVLSHAGDDGAPGLLEAFTASLQAAGQYLPENENTFAPALANRLDRNTEGLVIAAKTAPALRAAAEAIRTDMVEKTYLCVCTARPPQGVHHAWHRRDRVTHSVTVFAGQTETGDAKPISTGVTVLEEKHGLFLCKISLITGRTHQIRAHLAFLGAPILGDKKYGHSATGASKLPGQPDMALCAWQLAFSSNLPAGGPLAKLAGATLTAGMAALPAWWAALG